jgi:hypothetical protein
MLSESPLHGLTDYVTTLPNQSSCNELGSYAQIMDRMMFVSPSVEHARYCLDCSQITLHLICDQVINVSVHSINQTVYAAYKIAAAAREINSLAPVA